MLDNPPTMPSAERPRSSGSTSLLGRGLRATGSTAVWLVLGLLGAWCTAALYLDVRPAWLRWPALMLFAGALGLAIARPAAHWRRQAATTAVLALVMAWWFSLRPSNQRTWRPDVEVLPEAEISGNTVRLRNVRDCVYRTETDYDVRHVEKTLNLDNLQHLDLFLVYWGSPLIGHTMLSFGFGDGQYVCFSIETRMEQGEKYSALKGFFRQFELTYVMADERDVVRLRTSYRKGEEVYLYRLKTRPEGVRALFLDYLRRVNSLRHRPEWYNALTDNCTTNIRLHGDAVQGGKSPFDWRILLNGRLDELLVAHGAFASDLPLAEMKPLCHINSKAIATAPAEDFSAAIRRGLPGIGELSNSRK